MIAAPLIVPSPLQQADVGPTTVVLLGTDTPIGLAITRELGRHGHRVVGIGRSVHALAGASRYCMHHSVRASGGETALVAQIMELAERHAATCLVAIAEGDLLLLNRHRDRLESSLKVLVPTSDALSLVLDKAKCQVEAAAVGIRTPRSLSPASVAAVCADGELSYPAVLKWADPNAVAPVLSKAGLPLHKIDFALDRAMLLAKLAPYEAVGVLPMIQEYCPGHGLGQMFLARDGEILLEFQHERLHEWPPEGGVSSLCKAVPLTEHVEARERSRALLRRLRWTGVAMVEYRYDPATRSYAFMEINGRFWGSLPLAEACGVPFASGLVSACAQGAGVPYYRRDYPLLVCVYGIPETKRLLRLLLQRGATADPLYRGDPWASLLSYLTRPLRPSTRYYVLALTDPRPWFADVSSVVARGIRRLAGR